MTKDQDKIPITQEGLSEIKEEYQRLVGKKRPEVVKRLVDSREPGDLTEETDYTLAKQELAFVDGKIKELEGVIARAVLISQSSGQCREVKLGCRVSVKTGTKEHIFHLVGEWEANPGEKKISHQSPLGRALLGKKVGDKVKVKAPVGKVIYHITAID